MTPRDILALLRWGWRNDRGGGFAALSCFAAVWIAALFGVSMT